MRDYYDGNWNNDDDEGCLLLFTLFLVVVMAFIIWACGKVMGV